MSAWSPAIRHVGRQMDCIYRDQRSTVYHAARDHSMQPIGLMTTQDAQGCTRSDQFIVRFLFRVLLSPSLSAYWFLLVSACEVAWQLFRTTRCRVIRAVNQDCAKQQDQPAPIMLSSTTVLLALLASAWAAPASWVVHESRDSAPQGYVRSSAAPADHMISMRINLAQGNLAGLENALQAASAPSSPTFRQWLSTDQVSQAG